MHGLVLEWPNIAASESRDITGGADLGGVRAILARGTYESVAVRRREPWHEPGGDPAVESRIR